MENWRNMVESYGNKKKGNPNAINLQHGSTWEGLYNPFLVVFGNGL